MMDISIHALLAESDGGSGVGSWPRGIFLSTLSLRRATRNSHNINRGHKFLSTLSLRRATVGVFSCYLDNIISIHALLAESDVDEIPYQRQIDKFLSTLSLRRATLTSVVSSTGTIDFYPRSPCGERR